MTRNVSKCFEGIFEAHCRITFSYLASLWTGMALTHHIPIYILKTEKIRSLCITVMFLCFQDDKTASLSANSVKLSYAQMVQKTKVAEVSANSLADLSDESETDEAEMSQPPNRALKEQGQHPTQSGSRPGARASGKDFSRKDSRENDSESRRDDRDFRKDNDFRRDEPREQRMNRRAKENRERRFNDRDSGRRGDRRERDGPPPHRERDGPRTAPATSK